MAAIQAEMSSVEAAQWLASANLDPDESDRADVRHALLSDLLVALLQPRKRGQKHKSVVAEFLAALPWREEAKPQRATTPKELMAKINAAMIALGGHAKGTPEPKARRSRGR